MSLEIRVTLAFLLLVVGGSSKSYDSSRESDVFLYFGYGSNMLGKRLHLLNPTAIKIGGAALENYRLDFDQLSQSWRGAVGTIVPDENRTVYGVLWSIAQKDLENLDRQESVAEGIYAPLTVRVKLLSNNTIMNARSYELRRGIPANSEYDRRPSKTYLQCFVKGAEEAQLPSDYIRYLRSIEHNGNISELEEVLGLHDVQLCDNVKDQDQERDHKMMEKCSSEVHALI